MFFDTWRNENEAAAGYFAVFVMDYSVKDARRFVRHATPEMRDFMADQGKWHRAACKRGLAALVEQILTEDAKKKRLLPVVVPPNVELTGAGTASG